MLVCALIFTKIGYGYDVAWWYYVADAWIFVGSMLATYAMARGWVDFWLCWIAVDIVGVPELVHFHYYPSAIMYAIYAALRHLGLLRLAEDLQERSPAGAGRPGHGGRRLALPLVKSFEDLYAELAERARTRPAGSGTVAALDAGVHAIGKKIVEEAAEVWMAAEHECKERTAEEISQLLYHVQVLMLARGLDARRRLLLPLRRNRPDPQLQPRPDHAANCRAQQGFAGRTRRPRCCASPATAQRRDSRELRDGRPGQRRRVLLPAPA